MLSAAIAGLGGILLSANLANVNANTYIIFVGLALVMLTVVGGIGNVAGALMGGILAGAAFQALTSTFQNLSVDRGGGGFWSVMANLSLVAPALIGVSLGRSPSGAVPDIVASYRPLWQVKWVLALGVAAELAAYLLVVTNVMGNWWLVLATAAVAIVTPALGRMVRPEVFRVGTGVVAGQSSLGGARREPAAVTSTVAVPTVEGVADARS
jgi:hypothetical protein